MKYIIFEDEVGNEYPVIFGDTINHKDMAKKIELKVISAGAMRFDDCLSEDFKIYCYGESQTLGIRGRGEIDTQIIKRFMSM